ncbi:YdjY domain-containing protein [Roseiconus lacunae]|uniref:YdjY domain-containing protein n=1 Tax=Roseiconus lacunae TaxID=2605694 RepID=UPI0030923355|nr:YdjY domain-containing protein [Stieleria sp. HD01]
MIAKLSNVILITLFVTVPLGVVGCGGRSETSESKSPQADSSNLEGENGIVGDTDSSVESSSEIAAAPSASSELKADEVTENVSAKERSLPSLTSPENTPTEMADDATPLATPNSQWNRGPSAQEIAAKAFEPPPGATSLSKEGRLWIDPKKKRVYIDGYVAMTRGPLEMFACPAGTKEHESIVAALSRSRDAHAALLAVEASPGTPVRFRPEYVPPTGQVIRVWVCWYDSDGKFHTVDAREWIHDLDTGKAMATEWVFAGSGFWQDPEDNREYYEADSGDMICVSNFSSAMLDVAISSSADADALRFEPFESKIPARETPVRLVLVPVPNPTDEADSKAQTPDQIRPTADDVPRSKESENFTERSASS